MFRNTYTNWPKYISIAIYAASLTQNSFCIKSSCTSAFMCLIAGPIYFFSDAAGIVWIANPLLFTSWRLINREPKMSFYLGLIATAFGLSFLSFRQILVDEAGHHDKIISYGLGYWLWVVSMATTVIRRLAIRYSFKNFNKS